MTRLCTNCGAAIDADDRFCGRCGTALAAGDGQEGDGQAEDASWIDLAGGTTGRPVGASRVIAAPSPMESEAAPRAIAIEPAPIDHAGAAVAEAPVDPRRKNRRALAWLVVLLIGIVGAVAIIGWAMQWSRTGQTSAVVAEERDDPEPGGGDRWQAAYRDVFVGEGTVELVTGGAARQRDFPTTEGTTVQRTLPAGTSVTGRWVRGRDATTRWLKLADGGYVWEGNLAEAGGAGSPIELTISNRSPNFGPDVAAYLDQAEARQRGAFARIETMDPKERADVDEVEIATTFVRVPARRWRGLTVTAAALYYESHGVVFREDVETVRRALEAAGVRVGDDGVIPLPDEEAIGCSVHPTAQSPQARAYGATELICGV